MDYLSIEQGRRADGLRLVLVAGAPGAWGECIKAVYHVKGLDYQPVAQRMQQSAEALFDWTGQTSAPIAAYNDERIRITWENMLWQAEQLQPEPPLIPTNTADKITLFGMLRELVGECGFAWDRRLHSIATSGGPEANEVLAYLAEKYGYSKQELDASYQRCDDLLKHFSSHLTQQKAAGSRYYIGNSLTALDLYAAVLFAIMINPLPHDDIPMPEGMRWGFSQPLPCLDSAAPILFEHRDYIFSNYLTLPLDF